MKFLLDNNLPLRLARALRELKFDAVHMRDYAMQRASDEEIFRRALSEERIIVSADTDFGFLLARWDTNKPSLILFRRFTPIADHQLGALRSIIKKFRAELEEGSIIVIEPKGVRIRKLPLF